MTRIGTIFMTAKQVGASPRPIGRCSTECAVVEDGELVWAKFNSVGLRLYKYPDKVVYEFRRAA